MLRSLALSLIGAFALAAAPSSAVAGEQVLEYKIVNKPFDLKVTEVASIDGQNITAGKLFGGAFFKDGRIAVADLVHSADLLKGSGPYNGYATYTFDGGSSFTGRYTGSLKDGHSQGEITMISGTGAYANAKGTGTFENVPGAFKNASLYNVKPWSPRRDSTLCGLSTCPRSIGGW